VFAKVLGRLQRVSHRRHTAATPTSMSGQLLGIQNCLVHPNRHNRAHARAPSPFTVLGMSLKDQNNPCVTSSCVVQKHALLCVSTFSLIEFVCLLVVLCICNRFCNIFLDFDFLLLEKSFKALCNPCVT
jgi:hypothetical protein